MAGFLTDPGGLGSSRPCFSTGLQSSAAEVRGLRRPLQAAVRALPQAQPVRRREYRGSSCRTFATAATASTTSSGVTQALSLTGAFDSGAMRSTVTTLLPGGGPCSTTVATYRSIADFVDEVRVNPGVTLATTAVTTTSGACGSTTNTVTFSYDGSRRLTQFTSIGGTTSYTAWDGSGRPTSGSTSTGILITNVYDDSARTLTQTQVSSGSRTVNAQTFDANGIQTRVVVTDGSGATTSTTTFGTTATAISV